MVRFLFAALTGLTAAQAQSFQLTAPAVVSTGDLVSLRLTRDAAPVAGATLRVTAPAAEIGLVTAPRVLLRDGRTALFTGDQVLVTRAENDDCSIILSSGATGIVFCASLERRPINLGNTDADGRVLSRDLALVPATLEIAALRNGDTVATASLTVRPFTFDDTSPLGAGITARSRRWVAAGEGPFVMHTIEIDPVRADTFLLPVRARDRAIGLEPLTNLARRHGALASLSGAAFLPQGAYAGASTGPYLWNGSLTAAGEAASALFLCPNNRLAIQSAAITARALAADGQSLDLAGINRPRLPNQAILYTPLLGSRTLTDDTGTEAQLDLQDRVNELRDAAGNTEIPWNGRVISAQGTAADFLRQQAAAGALLRVQTTLPTAACPATDVLPSSVAEPDERRPRSAFSVTERGTWLLSVVDGNQAATPGMRQEEFAAELAALGATASVFLASGNGAALAVGDGLRSSPSSEKAEVGDALLLFQIGDLANWILVLDRLASDPGQLSATALDLLNAPLKQAIDAYLDGDTGGVREAVLKVRDLVKSLDGNEITTPAARLMFRATEAFITTLPDVQPLRRVHASSLPQK